MTSETSAAAATGDAPSGAYAQVNGLNLYYEVHGEGPPIVLLHGGLLNIDLSFAGVIPGLAKSMHVIAVDLQGHGRTADTGREFTFENLADDVAGLLDVLGIDRAALFGFSLGGLVATQFALSHPDRLSALVLGSTHFRADGYHAEIRDPRLFATSTRMPTQAEFQEMRETYNRVAPDPEHFDAFQAKLSVTVGGFNGWSDDEMRSIGVPTLIIIGDHDFVRIEHSAELLGLLPQGQLAVLPGTRHTGLTQRVDLIVPMLETFLA